MISDSKKYNNIKIAIGIGKAAASFILLIGLIVLGYSNELVTSLSEFTANNYLKLTLFVIVIGIAASVIFFPINYYSDFYLEHKYNLSNQTLWRWIWENTKGVMVGLAIGLPVLLIFYYVLNSFGEWWWLPFGFVMFLLSVILARIVPILILPLFYKVAEIEDKELKEKILKLSDAAGLKIENVLKFNMSKNTKKANAAFTGLGKSKRVLLGDTLLEKFTKDEIETVLAHEFGHYWHKHILKNIGLGTFFSFLSFFLAARLYELSLQWFGFSEINQIAALPLLILWGMIIGVIQTPLQNSISRKFEYEADKFVVDTTGNVDVFVNTLERLTEQNLGDKEPHPIIEWFFYSHPSIYKRTKYILSLGSNNLRGDLVGKQ